MASEEIIGYIVTLQDRFQQGGMKLCFYPEFDADGILLWGDEATIFEEPQDCRDAIKRSVEFRSEHHPHQGRTEEDYKIQPVTKHRKQEDAPDVSH